MRSLVNGSASWGREKKVAAQNTSGRSATSVSGKSRARYSRNWKRREVRKRRRDISSHLLCSPIAEREQPVEPFTVQDHVANDQGALAGRFSSAARSQNAMYDS
jgi:hypothetical protein